jgi:hypothetical protein
VTSHPITDPPIAAFLKSRVNEDREAALNGELGDVRYGGTDLRDNVRNQDRALREAHAKEAIIDQHPIGELGYCMNCWAHRQVLSIEAPCLTLRHLAAVYSDHPDYDQSWSTT